MVFAHGCQTAEPGRRVGSRLETAGMLQSGHDPLTERAQLFADRRDRPPDLRSPSATGSSIDQPTPPPDSAQAPQSTAERPNSDADPAQTTRMTAKRPTSAADPAQTTRMTAKRPTSDADPAQTTRATAKRPVSGGDPWQGQGRGTGRIAVETAHQPRMESRRAADSRWTRAPSRNASPEKRYLETPVLTRVASSACGAATLARPRLP